MPTPPAPTTAPTPTGPRWDPLALGAAAAAAAPSLLAYNVAPSPTYLNQALALALWGAWVALTAPAASGRTSWPLMAVLAVLAGGAAGSWLLGGLPSTLALSALGLLLATGVLALGGAGVRAVPRAEDVFAAFCWGWLVAGGANVLLALVQVFWPELPDSDWIARSTLPGRAVGNLRQPNHLSSLLLWSCIAAVALLEMRRLAWRTAAALLAALVFAVVLTASRTGLLSVLLLALWGLLDRRMSRPARRLLLAVPLLYAVGWLAMAHWAELSAHTFGGSERLAAGDISSSRFDIWRNTLALIGQHPWAGVGYGEFNLAWTLTPFPGRPLAFFDHTHNLPLQLAVELGLPLATAVMALLAGALWRGARLAWAAGEDDGTARRSAVLMLLMMGLHSALEYPLWYSYFLLPTAWAWGYALRPSSATAAAGTAAAPSRPLAWAGLALVVGAAFSVADYARVAVIFAPRPGAAPLEQRIADGQHSVLFGHHADYAAVTSDLPLDDPARAFDRVSHYLMDTRLMIAWSRSLAARGELDAARHLAARLREFHKADAGEYFQDCPDGPRPSEPGLPFQCEAPQRLLPWTQYLPRRP